MKSNYVLLLPIWGDEYINLFFDYTYKSLVQKGNINYLFKKFNSRLLICTTSKDKSKILKKLKEKKFFFKYDFCLIDQILKNTSNNKILHKAYLKGFKFEKRNHKNINFILLTADDIFSSNCLKFISTIIKDKKNINCILENKIIVNSIKFKKNFKKFIRTNKNIQGADLVKLALKNIDDFTKYSSVDEKFFNYSSYHLVHWVNKHNLLMHGYLLHPFLIRPNKQINKMDSFFDYYLVPEYVKSFKSIYIIKNSKNFVRVGLSNRSISGNLVYKYDSNKFAQTLKKWITPHHFKYSFNSTLFSSGKFCKKKLKISSKKIFDEVSKVNSLIKSDLNSHINHKYWHNYGPKKFMFRDFVKKNILYKLIKIFK